MSIFGLGPICQVGFVVDNLESALHSWWDLCGASTWHIYTYGPDTVPDLEYKGSKAEFRIRLTGLVILRIQPTTGVLRIISNYLNRSMRNGLKNSMGFSGLTSNRSFTGISTAVTSIMDLPASNARSVAMSIFWLSRASAGTSARPATRRESSNLENGSAIESSRPFPIGILFSPYPRCSEGISSMTANSSLN